MSQLQNGRAPLRVAVRATYPSVRAGLRAMLGAELGFSLVDEGSSDDDADVTVVDLDEGSNDETWPAGPAVLLGGSPAEFAGLSDTGVVPRAYLLKESTGAEIAAAVRAVALGLVVLDPAVAARLPRFPVGVSEAIPEPGTLTNRELDVLRLVAQGLPNKAIALQLGISEHTVKFHVGTVLGKLNAASRTEAVALAVRAGLLPL
jgi:DNA-binding CsgD family transcriptional regulator